MSWSGKDGQQVRVPLGCVALGCNSPRLRTLKFYAGAGTARRGFALALARDVWHDPKPDKLVGFCLRISNQYSDIQRVGVIKVEERVSYADAFALALAERLHLPLVTTDHHEFDAIEQKGHFRFLWLR